MKTRLSLVNLSLTSKYVIQGMLLPRFQVIIDVIVCDLALLVSGNTFKMADNPSEFTEAEKRRMEILNRQFALRQRMIKMKRRNIVIFGCLLASVAGIYGYTLFATRQEKLDFNE